MDRIDILTAIFMGATTSVMFLCALILIRGGLYVNREDYKKPNKLQCMFALGTSVNAILMLPYLINLYLLDEPIYLMLRVCDALVDISLGIIFLQALALQQRPICVKHYVITFGPTVPLFLMSFVSEEYHVAFKILECITELYLLFLIIYSLLKLKKWDDKILNYYSDVAHKQTMWYRRLCIPFLLYPIMWIVLNVFPEAKWLYLIYYPVNIVIFVRFTAMALAQEEFVFDETIAVAGDVLAVSVDESSDSQSDVSDTKEPVWVEKLNTLMTEKKVYRQDDLTVAELAKMLNINRTYLSNYINSQRGVNFYDFVNEYRLDECERLLMEQKHGITDIAMLCGFKDRNALYRIFRRRHDMSPSVWKSLQQSDVS